MIEIASYTQDKIYVDEQVKESKAAILHDGMK